MGIGEFLVDQYVRFGKSYVIYLLIPRQSGTLLDHKTGKQFEPYTHSYALG